MRSRSTINRRGYRTRHPRKAIFGTKRDNAKRTGVPFSLKFEDITWPDVCPVFGTRLEYACHGGFRDPFITPSFDRIDNTQGYVLGNVQVVSLAANRIKGEFTAAQVRAVADWLERAERK